MGHVPPCTIWKVFPRRRKWRGASPPNCILECVLSATHSENTWHIFAWRDRHFHCTHDDCDDPIVVCYNSYAFGCQGMLNSCTNHLGSAKRYFVSDFSRFHLIGWHPQDLPGDLNGLKRSWGYKDLKNAKTRLLWMADWRFMVVVITKSFVSHPFLRWCNWCLLLRVCLQLSPSPQYMKNNQNRISEFNTGLSFSSATSTASFSAISTASSSASSSA